MLRIYVVHCFKLFLEILGCSFLQLFSCDVKLLRQFLLSIAQNVSVILKNASKLFQYSSVVADLHSKELCDGLPASHCYQDVTVGLQLRALRSEVLACWANSGQKIAISL